VVIIWTAFFMLMMLGFVAIGVDVAKIMATRTELQNAADAAALAGASAVDLTTGKVRSDSALVRAQQTALRNEAFVDSPKPITLLAGDVFVDTDDNTVKVTVRRNAATDGAMITHVAQVLGIKNVDVNATATAKADVACEVCERLVPFGAVPPAGQTNFAISCGPPNPYLLKTAPGGAGTASPGNFLLVDFPQCEEGPCAGLPETGSSTVRCLVGSGYSCCLRIDQVIQSEPGNKAGPLIQGLQDRWDNDIDKRSTICHSQYTGNGLRVVNVPVITPLGVGRNDVRVTGFAAFFLRSRPMPNGEVWGEFIRDMVPGTSGVCNSSLFTVRLIQ
jgi:Flp pilus assembly protein TadG